ncbi:U3 small nucleolar RNA-associated protein 18 homolog [Venturia canescens]|uniref:U3 small nucleolar RNA-associated protein 18 homolog n=1 Tax=Venturia canescens TaxID=32260 RepID=UPI001C9C1DFE|nr:U3 small nucleolar RNA-associated protein 18 homolog [Venturia canescens]
MNRNVKIARKDNGVINRTNNNRITRKRKLKHENEVKRKAKAKVSEEANKASSCDEGEIMVAEDSSDENVLDKEETVNKSDEEADTTDFSEDDLKKRITDDEETEIQAAKTKTRKTKYNSAEETRLEKLVFGDPGNVIKNLLVHDDSTKKSIAKRIEGPSISTDESDQDDVRFEMETDSEDDHHGMDKTAKTVAWVDDNDENYSIAAALKTQRRRLPKGRQEQTYTQLLENKLTQIVGSPKWARLNTQVKNNDDDEDSDSEILRHSNHLTVPTTRKLRKGTIDIKVLTDINKSTHTEGPIVTSVEFHPTSTVAMVAGLSGILSLFQIDGRENTKLQSIRFEKFPINCAKFLHQGSEVIVGSRNCAYSHAYDLMSGKTHKIPLPHGVTNMQKFETSPDGKFIAVIGKRGVIHLLLSSTKELVTNFKMNRRCLAIGFSPNSDKLITHGDGEEMYIWDLKSRSCIHKAVDDGCITSSAITFSPSGQFLATGSKQGVVNVYETETVLREKYPKPLKIVLNLVTPITKLKFNPASEILSMASKCKENAFKMMHLPTFTVFSNFPTFQTKMFHPLDIDFSPGSGYLGLTNDKGYAYLYRLKHYNNY